MEPHIYICLVGSRDYTRNPKSTPLPQNPTAPNPTERVSPQWPTVVRLEIDCGEYFRGLFEGEGDLFGRRHGGCGRGVLLVCL